MQTGIALPDDLLLEILSLLSVEQRYVLLPCACPIALQSNTRLHH